MRVYTYKHDVKPGDRFSFLTVKEVFKDGKVRKSICVCDCGKEVKIDLGNLYSNRQISCGCYNRAILKEKRKEVAVSDSPVYNVWYLMKYRCFDPKCKGYHNYGGRGITVCEEWLYFLLFEKWAFENGYEKGLTIERKNNNGNYEPSNCTWITRPDQANNKQDTVYLTFGEDTLSLKNWADLYRIKSKTLHFRIKKGWSVEKSLTTPVYPGGPHNKKNASSHN